MSPEYVLDKMKWYEAIQYLKYRYLRSREDWEQTRWYGNLYINAHSKRKYDLQETISFPWEKQAEKLTKEQVKAQKDAAMAELAYVKDLLKNGKTTTVARLKEK